MTTQALPIVGAIDRERGLVLIVETDADERAALRRILTRAGWRTAEAATGHGALLRLAAGGVDAITLAVELGSESGYDLCAAIRAHSPVPIIFVTRRQDDSDHAFALNQGGDAYVTKPWNAQVLIAELSAAMRRGAQQRGWEPLCNDALRLERDAHRVTAHGREVPLSKTEFELLEALMLSAPAVRTRAELLEAVWGPWFGDAHVVEVTIARLRKKLAAAGVQHVIRTVNGIGYCMEAESVAATA